MTELITAIKDSKYKPSLTEADKIKNLAKNPAKGGMPASEKRKTSKEIALGLDVNLRPLRSEILGTMSEFTEESIQGKAGREALAMSLQNAINSKLEVLENFGGIDEVHFTSFVLQ